MNMIWLQAGQAFSTLIIGIVAALIAWRQWKTATEKIKLDLFDRRFKLFMDVRKIVSEGGQRREFSNVALPNEVIAQGRFLFGPEVFEQLSRLHDLCIQIETGDDQARSKLEAWYKTFIENMKPYMNFGHVTS